MKIYKLREILIVKALNGPYEDESFEYKDGKIKDWINGNNPNRFPSGPVTEASFWFNYPFVISPSIKVLDKEILSGSMYSDDMEEYVRHKIMQRLNIFANELNLPFENTEDIGVPYLEKHSKEELDLILREYIYNTPGVDSIETFSSRLEGNDNRTYVLDFEVKVVKGDVIWLSIEI